MSLNRLDIPLDYISPLSTESLSFDEIRSSLELKATSDLDDGYLVFANGLSHFGGKDYQNAAKTFAECLQFFTFKEDQCRLIIKCLMISQQKLIESASTQVTPATSQMLKDLTVKLRIAPTAELFLRRAETWLADLLIDQAFLDCQCAQWLCQMKIDKGILNLDKINSILDKGNRYKQESKSSPLLASFLKKGGQYVLENNYEKAIQCFKKIAELKLATNADFIVETCLNQLSVFKSMHSSKDLIRDQSITNEILYEQATRIVSSWRHRAAQNFESAMHELEIALLRFSNNPNILFSRGITFCEIADGLAGNQFINRYYQLAEKDFSRAVEEFTIPNPKVHFARAECYFVFKQPEKALVDVLIAVLNDSTLFLDSQIASSVIYKRIVKFIPDFKAAPENKITSDFYLKKAKSAKDKFLELINYALAHWVISMKLESNPKSRKLDELKNTICNKAIVYAKEIEKSHPDLAKQINTLVAKSKNEPQVLIEDEGSKAEVKPSRAKKNKKKKHKASLSPKLKTSPVVLKPASPENEVKIIQKPKEEMKPIAPALEEKKPEALTLSSILVPQKINYNKTALDIFARLDIPEIPRIYIVGGYVCEALKSTGAVTDIDFVVGTNEDLFKILSEKFPEAKVKKTDERNYCVIFPDNEKIDFRHSAVLSDSKLSEPEALKLDSADRDFTANALYGAQPKKEKNEAQVLDPTGRGYLDLNREALKSIIPMDESFKTDPIRAMRAINFKNKRKWKITDVMYDAIKNIEVEIINKKLLQENPGRTNHWMSKLLCYGYAGDNFKMLLDTGFLDKLLPGISKMFAKHPELLQVILEELTATDVRAAKKEKVSLNYIYALLIAGISCFSSQSIADVNQSFHLFRVNFPKIELQSQNYYFKKANSCFQKMVEKKQEEVKKAMSEAFLSSRNKQVSPVYTAEDHAITVFQQQQQYMFYQGSFFSHSRFQSQSGSFFRPTGVRKI